MTTLPSPAAAPSAAAPARRFLELAAGFWRGETKRTARLLTLGMLALVLANLAVAIAFNRWNKFFYDALERRDGAVMLTAVAIALGLAGLAAGIAVAMVHTRLRLQLRWRQWLTDRLSGRWLAERRFYQMTVVETGAANPEFRIADDARAATATIVDYGIGLTQSILTASAFVGVLWLVGGGIAVGGVTIPGYMVWAAIAYASATSLTAYLVGRPLVPAADERNAGEAKLRYELTRVRESAEMIALLGADDEERLRLRETFAELARRWLRVIALQGRVTWITNGNGALAPLVPLLLGAPKYFAGEITLGSLMQAAAAFTQVQVALNYFVDNAVGIADWLAAARRVVELDDAMTTLDCSIIARSEGSTIVLSASPDENIHLRDLRIALTDGAVMIEGADTVIRPGEKVLVLGASGSGKSTLVRAMAGLWPWGSGTIAFPEASRRMFLPRKPYLPQGTLRAVLVYGGGEAIRSDEAMRAALASCGLSSLVDRLGDAENWEQSLSEGEKQRVAFARLILDKPDIVIMDEATAALDEAGQDQLLALFRAELAAATLLSVAHRPGIERFHDRAITLARAEDRPAERVETRQGSIGDRLRRWLGWGAT